MKSTGNMDSEVLDVGLMMAITFPQPQAGLLLTGELSVVVRNHHCTLIPIPTPPIHAFALHAIETGGKEHIIGRAHIKEVWRVAHKGFGFVELENSFKVVDNIVMSEDEWEGMGGDSRNYLWKFVAEPFHHGLTFPCSAGGMMIWKVPGPVRRAIVRAG